VYRKLNTALTLDSVGHAFWTIRQAIEERPAESDALRAKAKGFDDVGPSANPAVEVDLRSAISAAIQSETKNTHDPMTRSRAHLALLQNLGSKLVDFHQSVEGRRRRVERTTTALSASDAKIIPASAGDA
jgi:hypothetical protein